MTCPECVRPTHRCFARLPSVMCRLHPDETLVELGQGVDRVGHMAGNINEELMAQNRMLDDFERDLDRAEEEMGFMLGKIAKLLKTKDHCQIFTVIALSFVILALLLAVIYG
mmetsp:Transcript_15718/g.59788  ORF Transcript_15718/g.59788 Transcript_15718/m.59788 type:complete len:112 (+) Transcript_15718:750-1085(+)